MAEEKKDKKYCGDSKEIPDGYNRRGTPYECLKMGYGAALYNATDEEIKAARDKARRRGPRPLSTPELIKLAKRFNIQTRNRARHEILNDVLIMLTDELAA